jgi:hypothetical protein
MLSYLYHKNTFCLRDWKAFKLPPPPYPPPFPEGGIYDKGEGLGGDEKWDFLYYEPRGFAPIGVLG